MITVFVSIAVSLATTAALYYVLHRANPAATQAVLDSAVKQAKVDVSSVGSEALNAAEAEVKKIV